MVSGIAEIYNDVLNILPYSVIGHFDYDKKLNEFYERLVATNFIKYNSKLTFLASALLNLPVNNNEHQEYAQLQEWKLESFKSFFYKTFVEGDKDEALSFYFFLCRHLADVLDLENLSTSAILSRFFIGDLDFRIGLIRDEKISNPNVKYDKRQNLFEVNIPISLFNTNKYENSAKLKLELNKKWYGKSNYIKRDDKLRRQYTINNQNENDHEAFKRTYNHFVEIYEMMIVKDKIKPIVETIQNGYLNEFAKFNLYLKDEKLYPQVARVAVCLSFLCYYYECYVEYMLSISKVDYAPNIKYGKTNFQATHRNIGGLIIAYNHEAKLDMEERAIFNIVSDRLAAVEGGQFLFPSTKYRISLSRKKRKELFGKIDTLSCWQENDRKKIYDVFHCSANIDENTLPLLESVLKTKENAIYFECINDKLVINEVFDKRKMFFIDGNNQNKYENSGLFVEKLKCLPTFSLQVNIPLLDKILNVLDNKNNAQYYFVKGEPNHLKIKIESEQYFSKGGLINKLSNRGLDGNGFLSLIEKYHYPLLSNGNLLIKINNEIVFNMEDHTQINSEGKLSFTSFFLDVSDFSSKEFTVVFQFLDF